MHHQYCKKIYDWKWSSYASLLSALPTNLLRDEVMEWFGNKEAFIKYHKQPIDIKRAAIFRVKPIRFLKTL